MKHMKHVKLFEGFLNEAKNKENPKKYGISVFSRDWKEKNSNKEVNALIKKYPNFFVATDELQVDDSILTVVTNYDKSLNNLPSFESLWELSVDEGDSNGIIWFNSPTELPKEKKKEITAKDKKLWKLREAFLKKIGLKKGDKIKTKFEKFPEKNGTVKEIDVSNPNIWIWLGTAGIDILDITEINGKPIASGNQTGYGVHKG